MGKQQDVSHLRVFGAKCWAKIPTVNGIQVTGGSKLDSRGVACRLLGYSSGHGNYKVQNIETCRVSVSRDTIFEEGHSHRTSPSVGEEWTTSRTHPRTKATLTLDRLSFKLDDYIACLTETKASHNIPQSYRHAMATDPDQWMVPMQIKMNTLRTKHTWDLVKPPPGANIMDSMWVYDIKWDGEGNWIKDKERLIVKGYTQQLGVDYNETWAGVTCLESVRMTAAITASD